MELIINIKDRKIKIILQKDKDVLDEIKFDEEYNLSEKLLPSVDEILKKNNLKTENISEMKVESDLDDSFTTYRIAKSVADSFNWAKSHNA
jgi:hypothetical protein